ncbi:hypothetical protein [Thermus scotoductus]|uniref:hypothetical protein n=1 Tax=Thermus scotoductus TaxID=37636 RepID=UPI000F806632|nr:hypothetical protein [Thermus scotoductus]RTI38676.1 hypothetical protein CSW18_07950 [Thermus scotoductus]
MRDRIVKGLVLGVGIVFAGLLWAILEYKGAGEVTVSPVMHAHAWPKREKPYVLLFYDPLLRWGWDEAEARAWLELLKPEVEASGLAMTPTTYVVDAVRRGKVIVGYPGYERWRQEVLSALGVDR